MSRVTRNGSRLILNGTEFIPVGANAYWLGLDENVIPNPSYPTKSRVLEIMNTVAAMGGNTVRSTTLGISIGTPLSIAPTFSSLRDGNSNNSVAFESIDYALFAARQYNLKLIIPLTDQYEYYHGGISTFLSFRNLSTSDHTPFYQVNSTVYQDFTAYISLLLSHRSQFTSLKMGEDPTILAFETGNELSGTTVEWTRQISKVIKSLSGNSSSGTVLVGDGSYGIRESHLQIAEVDVYTDHYYPPNAKRLLQGRNLAHAANKVYFVGEFDWTNHYYLPLTYLIVLLPVILALLLYYLLPARWWPWKFSIPTKKMKPRKSFLFRKWHFMILIPIIFCPILAGIIYSILPTSLPSFINTLKSNRIPNLYWSLFGHNDCNELVTHNDGFTLYYSDAGGTPSSDSRVKALIDMAYSLSNKVVPSTSPVIACPPSLP